MERLGRYTILGELGRGAMGVVYEAADPMLNRAVAIKTIDMAADPQERAEYEARFYQEAKAAGGLSHPNIVTIYDIGHAGDLVYMAMELIDGTELSTLLSGEPLGAATAVDIAAQVAEGLAFAHARGVVHRDIKPANIMVVQGGPAKIMDFGIARMRQSDVKTQTGLLLGSPKYMAPEQLLGQAIDHRCDIFALGVVLYEMLTGAPPFAGDDLTQIMYKIVHTTPPAPSAIDVRLPPMLDPIVAKALAKDRDTRYQTAGELAADLRACWARIAAPAAAPAPAPQDTAPAASGTAASAEAERQLLPPQAASAEPGPRLRISRRFDSGEATRKLAALTGNERAVDAFAKTMRLDRAAMTESGAPPESPGGSQRGDAPRRAGRGTLVLVASVTIAALVAVAIALG
ncbi:MAG TPA: serine/threonine-protein kinase [Burkholderiales bacterium]|nr:serine/threonine-protein kinase [Burkholderiales bacterium]